jgi:hypothetical protein
MVMDEAVPKKAGKTPKPAVGYLFSEDCREPILNPGKPEGRPVDGHRAAAGRRAAKGAFRL